MMPRTFPLPQKKITQTMQTEMDGTRSYCKQYMAIYTALLTSVSGGHDARVVVNSQLMAQAVNGNLLPPSPEWTQAVGPTDDNIDMPVVLFGDAAYPMSSWLLNLCVDRGRFTEEEQTFNYRLSKARIRVAGGTFSRHWIWTSAMSSIL